MSNPAYQQNSFRILSVLVLILLNFALCKVEPTTVVNETDSLPSQIDSITNFNSTDAVNNVDIKVKISNSEFSNTNTSSQHPQRKDKHFGLDSSIFEEYLKHADLSLIPGLEADDDFENWIPPLEVQRDIPSYLSGFDYQNQPIWVTEYGKYNYTKYANGGRKSQALFSKYFRYMTYVTLKSQAIKSTAEHPVNHFVSIIDFEGLTPGHLLNAKALQLQLKWARDFRRFVTKYCAKMVFINGNHLSESLYNVARPFVLSISNQLEVYGSNRAVWIPQILKTIPKDQLPERYGGNKEFKPIFVV